MRMRIISFVSMLRQEIGWFDKEENNLGALVTRLSSDTSSLKVNGYINSFDTRKILFFYKKGLSGLRIGVILNALGAIVSALIIAFIAGWKLTLVILLFVPLMIFSGMLQGRRMANAKKPTEKKTGNLSWAEKGGAVKIFCIYSKCI
jgi:ATP-binding cassette subfamily B (MDR/TAP) protein 1